MFKDQFIILAAGKGTRLNREDLPKVLTIVREYNPILPPFMKEVGYRRELARIIKVGSFL